MKKLLTLTICFFTLFNGVLTVNAENTQTETTTEVDYAALWNEFVEEYKKTDYINMYTDEDDMVVEVTNTDNSMLVTVTDKTDPTYTMTTEFTYEDGVVKYVPLGEVTTDNMAMLYTMNFGLLVVLKHFLTSKEMIMKQ